ncbi:MAG: sulfite exporter TauE/SafE family protein, partial [Pelagibacteraceae bacterium]|nr:sulfite exporter TauE/SafE family protein [Pelagibacteraceae bacterium]
MIDSYFYLTAAIGVVLFGISKGGFAGPMAILAIPIMALSMSPVVAAAILLPVLLVMDVVALYIYWNKWDLKNIKIIIPPAIFGIAIGALTFKYSSDDSIRIIIGTIAILFILFSIIQKNDFFIKPTKAKGIFWSSVGGYTSFIIHSG